MKKSITLLSFGCILIAGCNDDPGIRPATSVSDASTQPVPSAPIQHEKVKLEISNIGLNEGYLQLKVHNHTSCPLDLVNVSWYFYRKDGSPVMKGDYPKTIITTDSEGGTVIGPRKSKFYTNRQITFSDSMSDSFDEFDAEIKIYMLRPDFEHLGLLSDLECNESTIRQVFQSERLALKTGKPTNAPHQPDADRQEDPSPELEVKIVDYMRSRWQAISNSPTGYDPDKHDDLIASEAAAKYGITRIQALQIYIKSEMKTR